MPIIAASRGRRLAGRPGSVDVRPDADALPRHDEVSAVPLGCPHHALREPVITGNIHGDRRAAADDRRFT
ncbi:hypothetical protein ACFU3E_16770 [Streptomyces sp. NPDC057424]|uniref:hypothetical protein n=1 Tax=Streptomyces sp. NPDC057424 TaxID=3346127 RepID=UPI0036CAAD15